MQRRAKNLLFGGAAIFFFGVCLFLFFYRPPKFLEVYFFDVGQGDAELIKTPYGQNILIDGGPDDKVLAELGRHLPFLERDIDLLILTHPHDDHVSGLLKVMEKYRIGKILMTSAASDAPPFREFLRVVAEKGTPLAGVDGKQRISLGADLFLDILHPELSDLGSDLNEGSIVVKLIYKNKNFLFTGDAGLKTEAKLLSGGVDLRADVLKVGHHGSETASSLDFLRAVAPRFAVIEVGEGNQFGFPKADTLWRLRKVGALVWRTDLDGTIRLQSDGVAIWRK
jgi:competence protein ComEC